MGVSEQQVDDRGKDVDANFTNNTQCGFKLRILVYVMAAHVQHDTGERVLPRYWKKII